MLPYYTSVFDINKKLSKTIQLKKTTTLNENFKNKIKYKIRFSSLLAPNNIQKSSLLLLNYNSNVLNQTKKVSTPSMNRKNNVNRLLIQQSYILTSWIAYTSLVNNGIKLKIDDSDELKKIVIPKAPLVILPKRKKILTHLKAPMAHKTFSQEQFQLTYYYFFSKFNLNYPKNTTIPSINGSIYLNLQLRSFNFIQGTNVLEVQKFIFLTTAQDSKFFNLNLYNR